MTKKSTEENGAIKNISEEIEILACRINTIAELMAGSSESAIECGTLASAAHIIKLDSEKILNLTAGLNKTGQ